MEQIEYAGETERSPRPMSERVKRAWRKWWHFWRLADALGSIVIGLALAFIGLSVTAASVVDLGRGLVKEFGLGCGVGALFLTSATYCGVTGLKATREWFRAR